MNSIDSVFGSAISEAYNPSEGHHFDFKMIQCEQFHFCNIFAGPAIEVIALSPKTLLSIKSFICKICNKTFIRKRVLELHCGFISCHPFISILCRNMLNGTATDAVGDFTWILNGKLMWKPMNVLYTPNCIMMGLCRQPSWSLC